MRTSHSTNHGVWRCRYQCGMAQVGVGLRSALPHCKASGRRRRVEPGRHSSLLAHATSKHILLCACFRPSRCPESRVSCPGYQVVYDAGKSMLTSTGTRHRMYKAGTQQLHEMWPRGCLYWVTGASGRAVQSLLQGWPCRLDLDAPAWGRRAVAP